MGLRPAAVNLPAGSVSKSVDIFFEPGFRTCMSLPLRRTLVLYIFTQQLMQHPGVLRDTFCSLMILNDEVPRSKFGMKQVTQSASWRNAQRTKAGKQNIKNKIV